MKSVRIVSVFDGMACGMLAMQKAGIPVDRYVAFEIEKYAIQTSSHNFPMIEHRGDVFQADFTEFKGFDFLVGGSPCTYWSIAQKNNRETEASGMGWELFSQYVRALHEAKPKFFIYENNKSMSKAIRASIDEAFGFEAVCINSALVSAQNRQRLYWVGKRNPDGTYSKVHVEQPEDCGILLKDVLEGTVHPFGETSGKAYALTASYWKGQPKNKILEKKPADTCGRTCCNQHRQRQGLDNKKPVLQNNITNILNDNSKGCRFTASGVAEPVGIGYRGRMEDGKWVKRYESNEQPKANALTTCQTDSMVSEPVRVGTWPNTAKNQAHDSQQYRIYGTDGKSVTLCGNGGGMGAKTGLYAIPVEFDGDRPIKAVSGSDGKEYEVYEVQDGFITIKGKRYAIKLADGFYIIRKLTVTECKRLQTVPEWYEFPVSDTQAYKMLGNGWTVDVIAHLINATYECVLGEYQLNLFEMVVN